MTCTGCERHPTRHWTARTWRTVPPEAPSTPRNLDHSLFGGQCEHSLRVREFSNKECLHAAANAEAKGGKAASSGVGLPLAEPKSL